MAWSVLFLLVVAGGVASLYAKHLPPKVGNALLLGFVLVFIVFAIMSPETRKHDAFWAVIALAALARRMSEQRSSLKAPSLRR